jgi:hypothetical protein
MKRNSYISRLLLTLVLSAMTAVTLAAEQPAPRTPEAVRQKPLDLRPPDVTKLYSPAELRRLLGRTERTIEEIEVRGARPGEAVYPQTPAVWQGLGAPVWALLNPTQAWRIFAPLPPDQAVALNARPDATASFRPVAAPTPIR